MLVAAGVIGGLLIPVTTRQGVDFAVSTHRLPFYVKALDFIDRHANYQTLAGKITAGAATDEARALAVYEWTRANVRDVPPGFPIVDDHVWHIIVRGYGIDDQKADVFTTLATYAGVPAYWVWADGGGDRLTLSLARVGGRWRVFDVDNGVVFRNRRGELVTLEELAADPASIPAGARTRRGRPYAAYLAGVTAPRPPDILRAEQQMLWPRVAFEAKRLIGFAGRTWDPRPDAWRSDR